MSKNRAEELSRLGIDLYLTEDGKKLLSKILSEGCPVKMSCDGTEPIACPYTWVVAKNYNCERCWNNWLKDFVQED